VSFSGLSANYWERFRHAGLLQAPLRRAVRPAFSRPSKHVPSGPFDSLARVSTPASKALLRTPLFERHRAAHAKLVPFAGWEMPVQYPTGIRAEHMAVREGCGIFDVSHMGQIETAGPDALALLQRLLSNDASATPRGGAQYSVLCRDDGGVLDDLFTYRLEGGAVGRRPTSRAPRYSQSDTARYLTVTNAANHVQDLEWFRAHAHGLEVRVEDRLHDYAMLAVQGPRARGIVQALAEDRSRGTLASEEHPRFGQLPARMTAAQGRIAGVSALVCGTGYTGEDGVELLLAPADAPALWDALVGAGATPAGLAARDTLRLEACFHLYGNDLSVARGPIEAGLGWCCKEDTGFIGSDAVRAVRQAGPAEKLVAFTIDGPGIARQGNLVVGGGEVTSGTLSPCLGVGIGMAYVPAQQAALGTYLEIDVRGKIRSATVKQKPLYRKGS
jgi:aminomethyltransferase